MGGRVSHELQIQSVVEKRQVSTEPECDTQQETLIEWNWLIVLIDMQSSAKHLPLVSDK